MTTEWSRTTRYLVLVAFVAALICFVVAARPLVTPLILSGLLAFMLNPVVERLSSIRWMKRVMAVGIVYALFVLVLAGVPIVAIPYLVRQVLGFTDSITRVFDQATVILARPYSVAGFSFFPGDWLGNIDQFIAESLASIAGNALSILAVATGNVVWVLVILVTTYYFLKDGGRLVHWLTNFAPPDAQPEWRRLLLEIDKAWGSFLRGQLMLMGLVGALAAAVGAAVGLPGGVLLGVLAGFLDVIPSLGPTVAGAIAVLVALFMGSTHLALPNFWFGILVMGLYFLIQQVENIWLRPQVLSHSLRMHPGLVFVGVIGALALQGVLGALLIVPLMATVGILMRYLRCKLLGIDPWPSEKSPVDHDILSGGEIDILGSGARDNSQ